VVFHIVVFLFETSTNLIGAIWESSFIIFQRTTLWSHFIKCFMKIKRIPTDEDSKYHPCRLLNENMKWWPLRHVCSLLHLSDKHFFYFFLFYIPNGDYPFHYLNNSICWPRNSAISCHNTNPLKGWAQT
jgi:hypothetical protein